MSVLSKSTLTSLCSLTSLQQLKVKINPPLTVAPNFWSVRIYEDMLQTGMSCLAHERACKHTARSTSYGGEHRPLICGNCDLVVRAHRCYRGSYMAA